MNLSKLFAWVGVVSGVGLFAYGVKLFVSGLALGPRKPTAEQYKDDRYLGEMVYEEALLRGDPLYIAEFYRADTADLSEQTSQSARGLIAYGWLCILLGGAIVFLWWKLAEFL